MNPSPDIDRWSREPFTIGSCDRSAQEAIYDLGWTLILERGQVCAQSNSGLVYVITKDEDGQPTATLRTGGP